MEVAGVHVRWWQRAYRGLFRDEYLDGLRPEERAARYTFEGQADQPLTIVAGECGAIRGFATIGAPSTDARENRAERFYGPDGWTLDGGRRQDEVWGVLAGELRYRRALQ